ncbi:MAG: hypothetical protein HY461_01935 [Parcubacteria group bacterium]|nr:hypothetical protein [Parcubacteria group bacterium]
MNDSIINKIKLLKRIAPRTQYHNDLRSALYAHAQGPVMRPRFSFRESVASGVTMILATVFVIMLLIGGTYLNSLTVPFFLPGLHEEGLAQELENLDIQIKIAEAQYSNEAPRTVSVILNEAGSNSPNHLNNTLIQRERDTLDIGNPTNEKIDDVLNQIL